MNLRTPRSASLLLCVAGLIAIVASEATSAESADSARAQGEIVGVFTGGFTDGMPVYRFPPIVVLARGPTLAAQRRLALGPDSGVISLSFTTDSPVTGH